MVKSGYRVTWSVHKEVSKSFLLISFTGISPIPVKVSDIFVAAVVMEAGKECLKVCCWGSMARLPGNYIHRPALRSKQLKGAFPA